MWNEQVGSTEGPRLVAGDIQPPCPCQAATAWQQGRPDVGYPIASFCVTQDSCVSVPRFPHY